MRELCWGSPSGRLWASHCAERLAEQRLQQNGITPTFVQGRAVVMYSAQIMIMGDRVMIYRWWFGCVWPWRSEKDGDGVKCKEKYQRLGESLWVGGRGVNHWWGKWRWGVSCYFVFCTGIVSISTLAVPLPGADSPYFFPIIVAPLTSSYLDPYTHWYNCWTPETAPFSAFPSLPHPSVCIHIVVVSR